jgi:hypothetical protein
MGLLTALEKEAIDKGYPVRQVWKIWCPTNSSHASYDSHTIEDTGDTNIESRVVCAGERDYNCYNLSIGNPGDLELPEYTIVLSNADGRFYPTRSDSFFKGPNTSYESLPQGCYMTHDIYVGYHKLPSEYIGSIISVEYEDTGNANSMTSALCTIKTEPTVLSRVLELEWDEDRHANRSFLNYASWVLDGAS